MEDRIDAALRQSFPASDPPPWTLGEPAWALAGQGEEHMNPTKNDLSEVVRGKAIELLNARLADAVDLHSQCKQAHWNVRGPCFSALHALFDEVADDAQEYADGIAERIAQLGGVAAGTARIASQRSKLAEYPSRATSAAEHVEALATALATFVRGARAAIDAAADDGDAVTADLFTEVARGADKWLWMVEANARA